MPFQIPKIEYKNYSYSGTTSSGSAIVTAMTTTTSLEVGMFVKGTGIPSNTTILSVDSSSQITLSQNVTASNVGVSLSFGYEIEFEYPPVEPGGEVLDSKERISVSISGVRQVSIDFIEAKRKLKFAFLTEAIKSKVDTFMQTHALYGKQFRYFDDKTSVSYLTVELNSLKYDPKKIAPKGIDVYVWEFSSEFRRVL